MSGRAPIKQGEAAQRTWAELGQAATYGSLLGLLLLLVLLVLNWGCRKRGGGGQSAYGGASGGGCSGCEGGGGTNHAKGRNTRSGTAAAAEEEEEDAAPLLDEPRRRGSARGNCTGAAGGRVLKVQGAERLARAGAAAALAAASAAESYEDSGGSELTWEVEHDEEHGKPTIAWAVKDAKARVRQLPSYLSAYYGEDCDATELISQTQRAAPPININLIDVTPPALPRA